MRQRRGWPGQRRPVGEPVRPPALATDQADLPQSGIRPRRSGSRQSLLLSGPGGTRSRSAARQSASCGEIPPRHRRLLRACCTRPGDRIAECDQQFPPSDGDCQTPLPCEVRKGTIPRYECAVLAFKEGRMLVAVVRLRGRKPKGSVFRFAPESGHRATRLVRFVLGAAVDRHGRD